MKLPLYQIDAFASRLFGGNPAAVCPLDVWLPDELMQDIAAENNLSETAFFVPAGENFHIRWFTPTTEVDLCGHATLASAYVIFHELAYQRETITFESRSGPLRVQRQGERLQLDFPAQQAVACESPAVLIEALGCQPLACLQAADYLVVVEDESTLASLQPDFSLLQRLDLRGVAVTASSRQYDFVCRFFAPKYGIDEDPVTGSAYTQLVPYWAEQLHKTDFHARQLSLRGGELWCQYHGQRVLISGTAVKYLQGSLFL